MRLWARVSVLVFPEHTHTAAYKLGYVIEWHSCCGCCIGPSTYIQLTHTHTNTYFHSQPPSWSQLGWHAYMVVYFNIRQFSFRFGSLSSQNTRAHIAIRNSIASWMREWETISRLLHRVVFTAIGSRSIGEDCGQKENCLIFHFWLFAWIVWRSHNV